MIRKSKNISTSRFWRLIIGANSSTQTSKAGELVNQFTPFFLFLCIDVFFILLRSGNVILSRILFLNILEVKINDKLKYLLRNVMGLNHVCLS